MRKERKKWKWSNVGPCLFLNYWRLTNAILSFSIRIVIVIPKVIVLSFHLLIDFIWLTYFDLKDHLKNQDADFVFNNNGNKGTNKNNKQKRGKKKKIKKSYTSLLGCSRSSTSVVAVAVRESLSLSVLLSLSLALSLSLLDDDLCTRPDDEWGSVDPKLLLITINQ